MALETAPYTVMHEDGSFELRSYPSIMVVETNMDGLAESNRGFGRLFRYISGQNEAGTKIAMTTPVFMTAQTMQFVVPAAIAEQGAPSPSDPTVRLLRTEPMEVAVFRFSGGRSERNERRAETILRTWMQEQGLVPEPGQDPVFAYYNSPWTPPFLRRNEVLLRLEHAGAAVLP